MSLLEEKEALRRIAEDDERIFGQLVDRYWQAVYEHALTFLKSPATAEEATLDVFEKVWHQRTKLREVDNFKNWLYITSKHLFISLTRKKIAETPRLDAREYWIEEVQIPGKSLEIKELATIIEAGIAKLKPHQKQIFLLSRQQGLTHEQIAERLGLSRHTVKGHLVNSLNFLRQFLYEQGGIIFSLWWLSCQLLTTK